jgi:tripartite-type tricarboxylate transporter receptor subunit TctC
VSAASLSRIVAAALSVSLGGPVIVDAKPGAGGNIASEFASRAAPDCYTIILLPGGHAVSAALYRKLRFHPVESFDFISLVGTFPFVVATGADGPIASLADVTATARQQPGKLLFSSVDFGSVPARLLPPEKVGGMPGSLGRYQWQL